MAVTIPGDGVPQGPGTSAAATGTCWGTLQVLPRAAPLFSMWKPEHTGERGEVRVCTGFILRGPESIP